MNPYTLTQLFWLLLLIVAVVLHVLWRRRVEHEKRTERKRRERMQEQAERRRYRTELQFIRQSVQRWHQTYRQVALTPQKKSQIQDSEGGHHASR